MFTIPWKETVPKAERSEVPMPRTPWGVLKGSAMNKIFVVL